MARFSKTRGGASFTAPGRGRREVGQGGWRMTRDPADGRRPLFLVGLSRCEVSVCRRERRPIWQKGVEVHGRSCPVCVKIPTLTAFVCRRPQSILETHIATTPNERRPAAVLRYGCAQAEAMLSIGSGCRFTLRCGHRPRSSATDRTLVQTSVEHAPRRKRRVGPLSVLA